MNYFGTDLTSAGHYVFNLDGEYMESLSSHLINTLSFHPEYLVTNLPIGEVIYYQGGGYTVVGFAGSCYDKRPGSKSIYWVRELITKEEMIERIKKNKLAMKIINNYEFKINW